MPQNRDLPHGQTPSTMRLPNRRGFLQAGAIGGLGLCLGDVLRLQAQTSAGSLKPTADSVIHIFLPGGMSAQESFDPKRYAPVEYRGPYGSIPTKITGEHFGDPFPKTAQIADKLTIVRSMTHGEAAHARGTHNMFTGYRPSPALQFPSFGSVIGHELGSRKSLPPYVCIPRQPNVYAGSGYLSTAHGPFSLGADPAARGFRVRDLALPRGVDEKRFDRRRKMLDVVDERFRRLEKADTLDAMDSFYKDAYKLISSPEARDAFDIRKEPAKLRSKYGQTQAGQRMLMARRLVEAGVRMVSLTVGGWDHHDNIRDGFRRSAAPLDQAYAALITDLHQRGMLDRTLVLLTTEFGRTPRINGNGGRDHYPRVFSIVLAGGGMKQGYVYGKSNATSTEPDEDPLTVPDWATTVYRTLGIDAEKELVAPGGRPIEIVKGGRVVNDLLA